MTEKLADLVCIELVFLGSVPDYVQATLKQGNDSLVSYRFEPIQAMRFRHWPGPGENWDRAWAALVERLGGMAALHDLAREALPLRKTLTLVREAMWPDAVDGPGPFSLDSDYCTIALSNESVAQLASLGMRVDVRYRITPAAAEGGTE